MPPAVPSRLLPIYLNDHFAGSMLGVELARRAARENAGTPLGTFLADDLLPELLEDRRSLRDVMTACGVQPSRAKVSAAWVAEKIGRLKLNGETRRYSPLSRLLELEGLEGGIASKRAMWLALADVRASDDRLGGTDFELLARRAESQLERLEPHRIAAAGTALR